MSHWKSPLDASHLNQWCEGTLAESLGIEMIGIDGGALVGKMPVDHRTKQPFGLLHGGASLALAETVGSMAGMLCLDMATHYCVGIELNGNHLRSASSGWVTARAKPLQLGSAIQVWDIPISDDEQNLICATRLTLAVRKRMS